MSNKNPQMNNDTQDKQTIESVKRMGAQILRLAFQTGGCVGLFYCFRYQILDGQGNDQDQYEWAAIWLIQVVYWIMSFIAESITYRILVLEWSQEKFLKLKIRIKLFMLLYFSAALGIGYLFASEFLGDYQDIYFQFQSPYDPTLTSKIVYGIELGVSFILGCNFYRAYRRDSTNRIAASANRIIHTSDDSNGQENNDFDDRENFPPFSLARSVMFSGSQVQSTNNECCCCSFEIDQLQKIIILPCKHAFHATCIRDEAVSQKVCPKCQAPY